MTKDQQQDIIKLIQRYDNTDNIVIKANIRQHISKYKYDYIADSLGLGIQTVYSWTKIKGNKPSFLTALLLCELLDITIDKLIN